MGKQVIVRIKNGKARVETEGYQGRECMDATASLEKKLGVKETDVTTPEFNEVVVRTVSQG